MNLKAFSKASKQDYRTPQWLFDEVQKLMGIQFALDVAASVENTMCTRFLTAEDNGLKCPWESWTWCNPPYARILPWARKALTELYGARHARSVLLLPARVETTWYRELHLAPAVSVFHLFPRLNFIDPDTMCEQKGVPLTSTLFVVGVQMKRVGYLHAKEGRPLKVEYSV